MLPLNAFSRSVLAWTPRRPQCRDCKRRYIEDYRNKVPRVLTAIAKDVNTREKPSKPLTAHDVRAVMDKFNWADPLSGARRGLTLMRLYADAELSAANAVPVIAKATTLFVGGALPDALREQALSKRVHTETVAAV